jgi:cell division FtsZ-interacting protein ZapD
VGHVNERARLKTALEKNFETGKQELMTWKTGEAYVFQPGLQLHNGFNDNPRERTTLLIDFWKESQYTKESFEEYYQHYSACFEGLENLVDVYESRKNK